MLRLILFVVLGLAAAWGVAAVAAELASRTTKPRGELVDIDGPGGGGRKLRLVCEGPRSGRPVVWMESGAFSGAADFAAIQQMLTAKGMRSCAYDRAALIALAPEVRGRYVEVLRSLLPDGGKVLLVAFVYDQSKMAGPPFSLPEGDVRGLFEGRADLTLLEAQDLPDDEAARVRERGCDRVSEAAWLVRFTGKKG